MANNVDINTLTGEIKVTFNPASQGPGRFRFDIDQAAIFARVFSFPDFSVYGGAPSGQEPQLLQHMDFEMHVRDKQASQTILLAFSTFAGGIQTNRTDPVVFQFDGLSGVRGLAGTAGTLKSKDIVRVSASAGTLADFDTRTAVYDMEAIVNLVVDFDSAVDLSGLNELTIDVNVGTTNRTELTDTNPTGSFSGVKPRDIIRFKGFTQTTPDDVSKLDGDFYVESVADTSNITLTRKVNMPADVTSMDVNSFGTPLGTVSHSRFIHTDFADTGNISIAIDSDNQPIITSTTVGAFKATVTRNTNASFVKFAVGDGAILQSFDVAGDGQWTPTGVHNSFHIVKSIDGPGTQMTFEANDIGGSETGIGNLLVTRVSVSPLVRLLEGAFINSLNVTRPTLPSL